MAIAEDPVAGNSTGGRGSLLLPTELALAAVSAAAVQGMDRLFLDSSFQIPLLLQVLLAHLTVAALRRGRRGLGTAALATLGAGLLAISWTQYADTLWVVLPSADTWSTVLADVDHSWFVSTDESAPVPVEPGFVVAASAFIWLLAFVADWAAFRTSISFEALLPSATLFLLAALLGQEGPLGAGAAVYAGAALCFLLVHRTWRQERTAPWAAVQRRRGRRSLLVSGAALGSVAVLVGAAAGPAVPSATDPPLIPWRDDGNGEDTRVVVSPLVDVRSRLVDQTNLELFTVRTDDPGGAYWRLTTLDHFDGEIFRSTYQTDDADGELPRAVESRTQRRRVTQEVTITALDAIWLPAAYEPVAFDGGGDTPVIYDERSSTLLVDKSVDTSDGLQYTVVSDVPIPATEELRGAPEEIPGHIADRYLQLPDDFSQAVEEEAEEITAGAETRYDKVVALQNHLRTFDYSQELQGGHGEDALEQFLFHTREGFCQQFAAAHAVMARSLGIPTRVAVGFTKGIQDPNEPTLFRVTGKFAHAWVEVYFKDYGWVTMDPTPDRAPPDADSWLPVPEEQADRDGDGTSSTTVPPEERSSGPPAEPGPARGGDGPAREEPGPAATPELGLDAEEETSFEDQARDGLAAVALTLTLGVLPYAILVPGALLLQQRLRRWRARRPEEQVSTAWDETQEQADRAGIDLPATLTVQERAAHLRTLLPELRQEIDDLAGILELTLYAGVPPGPQDAVRIRHAADAVSAAFARQQPWYRRALAHLDARRLLPRRRRRRRSAHGAERTS